MSLFTAQAAADWAGGRWEPRGPSLIAGVCHDSRTVRPNDLFVALTGPTFDGHDFLDDVFGRGACGAVVAEGRALPAAAGRPLLRVDDPAAALRRLAAGYRQAVNPAVVAVTGSAGKSTVKEMTTRILATRMPAAGTRGNWNNDIGLPLSLLAMAPDTRVGVFEVGMNHPGETRRLCALLKPTWGVVTNVGPVHIEFFESVEAIAREKAEVLRSLPPDGMAVLSRECACFEVFQEAAPGRVVTVSVGGAPADYVCRGHGPGWRELAVQERASGKEIGLRLRAPGEHNAANALLAAAVAREFGVPWDDIVRALESYAGLPMRWETRDVRGITLINDAYNANPLSMRAALRAFADLPCAGRKWLALGDMLELGALSAAEHRALGALVARGGWAGLIAVGPLGRLIAEGAAGGGMPPATIARCADNPRAAAAVAERARPGDAVLLKASRGLRLEEALGILASQGEG